MNFKICIDVGPKGVSYVHICVIPQATLNHLKPMTFHCKTIISWIHNHYYPINNSFVGIHVMNEVHDNQ